MFGVLHTRATPLQEYVRVVPLFERRRGWSWREDISDPRPYQGAELSLVELFFTSSGLKSKRPNCKTLVSFSLSRSEDEDRSSAGGHISSLDRKADEIESLLTKSEGNPKDCYELVMSYELDLGTRRKLSRSRANLKRRVKYFRSGEAHPVFV
jgi:hypothetical protein